MTVQQLTPDLAYAAAVDYAYGTAIARRHWESLDDREEALWDRFRELLGHPSEDEITRMIWEYREPIARIVNMMAAYSVQGYAVIEFRDTKSCKGTPIQQELPL